MERRVLRLPLKRLLGGKVSLGGRGAGVCMLLNAAFYEDNFHVRSCFLNSSSSDPRKTIQKHNSLFCNERLETTQLQKAFDFPS